MTSDPRPKRRPRLPVIAPDGRRYDTATAAALANKVRPSTVWMNARLGRNGWRLAEPDGATSNPA